MVGALGSHRGWNCGKVSRKAMLGSATVYSALGSGGERNQNNHHQKVLSSAFSQKSVWQPIKFCMDFVLGFHSAVPQKNYASK